MNGRQNVDTIKRFRILAVERSLSLSPCCGLCFSFFTMKRFFCIILAIFLFAPPLYAQKSTSAAKSTADTFPSVDEMIKSMSAGGEFSLADSIQDMMDSMGSDTLTENTEATVRSSIEGRLVVEETVPEVNREVVEAIDTKTQRYSPRLQLDFKEFPLREISKTAKSDLRSATGISDRVRSRLRSEGITLVVENRTVRLQGTVDTARRRDLAEIMLRFEPGVDLVVNELLINE